MTNNAFWKLTHEFDLNYQYQEKFKEYCDNLGIIYKGFYGEADASTDDKKSAREFWKKNHKVWFKDLGEVDAYIDNMPMGGYKTEMDAQKVLVAYRKSQKERV